MASIERRELQQADRSGRVRTVVRYKIRYRDHAGREHSETKRRLLDAERRVSEIEVQLANGSWRDPRRGELRLSVWAAEWVPTRHDLRESTRARLEMSMSSQQLVAAGASGCGEDVAAGAAGSVAGQSGLIWRRIVVFVAVVAVASVVPVSL